jgi:hypothetical protein
MAFSCAGGDKPLRSHNHINIRQRTGSAQDLKEKATNQFENIADKASDKFRDVADKAEHGCRGQVGEGPANGDPCAGRRPGPLGNGLRLSLVPRCLNHSVLNALFLSFQLNQETSHAGGFQNRRSLS